ncbi:hypothetical protein HDU78_003940 [Chytriomyces hyalinus]|nr:hypothetical protein HDU78_003940 [Chytriomyces hyalinus]
MFKSIATFLAAAALALLVAYIVPFSATDIGTNPIKKAIGFSTQRLAAQKLLSAPLTIIDAAVRNYPQTFTLFFKQPWNITSVAVLLVFLPVIIDALQHATVQSLVVQGVARNTGTTNYVYLNTSTIKSEYEPLLSDDNGKFDGLSPIAAIASANGISAVANACSNITRTCGTSSTNATTALISCGSEVDCTSQLINYHDFDMICTRNETTGIYNTTSNWWLDSSISLTDIDFSGSTKIKVVDWTLRRMKPFTDRKPEEPVRIAAVHCKIVGAWVTRYESQLRGTLNKTVIRRYDSTESASKRNTTDVDSLSNLEGKFTHHLSSSMGYLDLALRNAVVGGCRGQMNSAATPYNCDKSVYLLSWAANPVRDENDVAMLEQEMRFTVEMMMKHLFINVMPQANRAGECKDCSTRNAHWVSLPAASAFFGVILGLVMLFAGTSIYLAARYKCEDSLFSAKTLFISFGGVCDSGEPIVSVDKLGQIVEDRAATEQTYLIADQ